jgi:hypothetical protein
MFDSNWRSIVISHSKQYIGDNYNLHCVLLFPSQNLVTQLMMLFQLHRFCNVDWDEKMVVNGDYIRVMMVEVWPILAVTSKATRTYLRESLSQGNLKLSQVSKYHQSTHLNRHRYTYLLIQLCFSFVSFMTLINYLCYVTLNCMSYLFICDKSMWPVMLPKEPKCPQALRDPENGMPLTAVVCRRTSEKDLHLRRQKRKNAKDLTWDTFTLHCISQIQ